MDILKMLCDNERKDEWNSPQTRWDVLCSSSKVLGKWLTHKKKDLKYIRCDDTDILKPLLVGLENLVNC